MIQGTCLCGTVRFRYTGEIVRVLNCHCATCRRHHGTSWSTFAVGRRDGFEWQAGEDAIRHYATSPQVTRAFCSSCGAKVPMLAPAPGPVLMPAGALDAGFERAPELNVFVASRTPWTQLDPSIPAFAASPPGTAREPLPDRPDELPEGTVGGSCLCGAVAWQVDAPPLRMYHCHCERCRKARGTGFATNVFYPVDAFRWLRGEHEVERYALPGAKFFGTAFCGPAAAPRPGRRGSAAWPRSRPAASIAIRGSVRPHTSTWARRRRGIGLPTRCRDTTRCPRPDASRPVDAIGRARECPADPFACTA